MPQPQSDPQQAPAPNAVGLAIVAFLIAGWMFSWPVALVMVFFVLLIAIAVGVWKIATR